MDWNGGACPVYLSIIQTELGTLAKPSSGLGVPLVLPVVRRCVQVGNSGPGALLRVRAIVGVFAR